MEKPLPVPLDSRAIERALSELAAAASDSRVQVIEDPAGETAFALPAIRLELETRIDIDARSTSIDEEAPVGSPAYWRRQMELDAIAPSTPERRSLRTWVRKLTRRAQTVGQ